MTVNQYENSPPSPAIGGGGFLRFAICDLRLGDFECWDRVGSKRTPSPFELRTLGCRRLIRDAED